MDQYTELTGTIIGAAIEVHSYLGPGLIESIYVINFNVVKLKEGIRRLSLA